jgi:hypothetical protein
VKLTYRVVESARKGDWRALSMNETATAIYEATVGNEELQSSLNPPSYGAPATLEYYVQAYDGIGNRSESPTGTVIVNYCLHDTTGPTISGITESDDPIYSPPGCEPSQVIIRASVFDPSGVSGAKLTYRVVDGSRQGDLVALAMTEAEPDTYEATVGYDELRASLDPPLSSMTPATLKYYIQAYDSKGNHSESPMSTVIVNYCLW